MVSVSALHTGRLMRPTEGRKRTLTGAITMSNGFILYQGPSMLDEAPIVVIATGIKAKSSNRKTGSMIQTYILRADVSPVEAVKAGLDSSICGDCPQRGDGFKARTCYVNVGQGARSVWEAYKRGTYPVLREADRHLLAGRAIRLGTYGDPAAAPVYVWQPIVAAASLTTGYTHQWRNIGPEWADLVMASADTLGDHVDARELGFRTFRVTLPGDNPVRGEVLCPASEEAGKKLTCETCGACNGNRTGRRGSVYIPLHGSNAGQKGQAALRGRLIAAG